MDSDYALKMIPGIPFPQLYEFFMDWKTPVGIASVYAICVHLLNPSAQSAKVSRVEAKNRGVSNASKSSKYMTAFVFIHNMILSIYSGITFVNMARHLHTSFSRETTLHNAYCGTDNFLWNEGLGYWGYIFYLSKFYEVIDTAIILMKGRRSSLLQTYHHSGAMITMWAGIRFQGQAIWIFVVFNSLVHSVMYLYYAMTSVGFHPPGKRYLTTMQITQFLVGMSVAISYAIIPSCLKSSAEQFGLALNIAYLLPLTYLFVDFARKTYGKRKAVNGKKVE